MSALENVHYGLTPLKMSVPSNTVSTVFEGIGGDVGYSHSTYHIDRSCCSHSCAVVQFQSLDLILDQICMAGSDCRSYFKVPL